MGEAVEPFELFDAAVGAEFGEQSAAADALELAGITDEGEPPPVASASDTIWWRAGVESMPASSTISVAPAGSWNSGSGGRSVRCHS